jgi:hypothetical protein
LNRLHDDAINGGQAFPEFAFAARATAGRLTLARDPAS